MWLWRRLAATPLAWVPPYAACAALKRQKNHHKQQKNREALAEALKYPNGTEQVRYLIAEIKKKKSSFHFQKPEKKWFLSDTNEVLTIITIIIIRKPTNVLIVFVS